MKKLVFSSCATLLLFLAGSAFGADVTGKWTGQMGGPDGGGMSITFNFQQDGAKLDGNWPKARMAHRCRSVRAKWMATKSRSRLKWEAGGGMKILHEGTINGDEIKLTIKMDGGEGPGPMTLKRVK